MEQIMTTMTETPEPTAAELTAGRRARLLAFLRTLDARGQQTCTVLKSIRHGREEFCVEGAACELYRKETRQGQWEKIVPRDNEEDFEDGVERFGFRLGKDLFTGLMPMVVRAYFGLPQTLTPEQGYRKLLIHLNDDGWTLAEIADLIEAQTCPAPLEEDPDAGE